LTNRLRTEGTQNLLGRGGEGWRAPPDRSGFHRLDERASGARIKDESDPLDASPPKGMRRSLAAIAALETMVPSAREVEGVVLRYGNFYGPESAALLDAVRHRKLPVVGGGAGLWCFIHPADAADATIAALDHGGAGLYNVVDDEPAPASEWIPYLAHVAGAKPPLRVRPGPAGSSQVAQPCR
jgi:nucleoside-diphosphate-sugar epimerase